MRRRKSRRPAPAGDHIIADDSPESQALLKRIAQLGLGRPGASSRAVKLDVPEYFAAMVDDLAARQGIGAEGFMGQILTEGPHEAHRSLHR